MQCRSVEKIQQRLLRPTDMIPAGGMPQTSIEKRSAKERSLKVGFTVFRLSTVGSGSVGLWLYHSGL